jgi:hypothetical protein
MSTQPQVKKGYVRGVRGVVATAINADGTEKTPTATPYGIRTSPQVAVSVVQEGGASTVLRGGDKILAYVKDPDTVVAVNLTLQNARLDAAAIATLAGGTLIADGTSVIVGWRAPTIEAQQNPPYFRAEVYGESYGTSGQVEGYAKYTFGFCRATFGNETLQDKAFVIPEIKVECFENPSTSLGVYSKEIVATLPTELS